jgi:hypothetical protein
VRCSRWVRSRVYGPNGLSGGGVSTIDLVGDAASLAVDVGNGHTHPQGWKIVIDSISIVAQTTIANACVLILEQVEDPAGTPVIVPIRSWPLLVDGVVTAVNTCLVQSNEKFEGGMPLSTRASAAITKTAKLRLRCCNLDGSAKNFSAAFTTSVGVLSFTICGRWLPENSNFDWDTTRAPDITAATVR